MQELVRNGGREAENSMAFTCGVYTSMPNTGWRDTLLYPPLISLAFCLYIVQQNT